MFSEEDLDEDLTLCLIYRVWLYFGSVPVLSHIGSRRPTVLLLLLLLSGSDLGG